MRDFLLVSSLCFLLFVGFVYTPHTRNVPGFEYGTVTQEYTSGSIIFSGDIMLGRVVEDLMREFGLQYPFQKIEPIIKRADLAIANFESAVPEVHVKTPPYGTQFSVQEPALQELTRVGFDVLSLSNNHALDYGDKGFAHTIEACTRAGIVCAGHPILHSSDSLVTKQVGDTTVGILMLHTLFEAPGTSTLKALIDTLESSSEIQLVFIHWGTEYERFHNSSQEALAHYLIEEGVDGIVGHHPHVMQDIELYKGKPIFYSLGNLIFDQYFSDDVQRGYFVQLDINAQRVTYTLLPYEMPDNSSQPVPLSGETASAVFATLLREQHFAEHERATGVFTVER